MSLDILGDLDGKRKHHADDQILTKILTVIDKKQALKIFEILMENGNYGRMGEWVQILGHHTDTLNEEAHIRDTNNGILYVHNDA